MANLEKNLQISQEKGDLILDRDAFTMWKDPARLEKIQGVRAKYSNVDAKDFMNYYDFSNTTLRAEEPVCCQELYAVLDKCIQEVLVNENADVQKLMNDACEEFQKNHLDKLDV